MDYLSVYQYAEKYSISERTAHNYCALGKIDVFLTGKTWNIPTDDTLPQKHKTKTSPLLSRLREEKASKLSLLSKITLLPFGSETILCNGTASLLVRDIL